MMVEFAPQAFERLSSLKEETGAISNSEVVGHALALFEWFLNVQDEGAQVRAIRGDVVSVLSRR